MVGDILFRGSYEEIERIAGQLRERVDPRGEHYGDRVRGLLEKTVNRLGGKVRISTNSEIPEELSGALEARGRRDFTIWLSPYTSPLRDNFTISHELAHYFLHYDHEAGERVVFNRRGSDVQEWQANRFAAAFLMPKDEFSRLFQESSGDIFMLGGHFGVSVPAVEVRAASLGLA